MDRKDIDILLRKYYEGESSLTEEEAIRKYFAETVEISPDLEADKKLFEMYAGTTADGISEEDLVNMIGELEEKKSGKVLRLFTRPVLYRITAIAATLALLVTMFIGYQYKRNNHGFTSFTETYKGNPGQAYDETKRVLLFVSQQFNRGTSELASISKINEPADQLKSLRAVNKSLEKLKHLDLLNAKPEDNSN